MGEIVNTVEIQALTLELQQVTLLVTDDEEAFALIVYQTVTKLTGTDP